MVYTFLSGNKRPPKSPTAFIVSRRLGLQNESDLLYNPGMEQITLRNLNDIQSDKKRWLEDLLGQQIQGNQQALIMVFTPGGAPDEATRQRAATGIRQTLDQARAHADAQGITDIEIDAAVDEAMQHVRPRAS